MPKVKGRGRPKGWKTLAILEDWCHEEICTVCNGGADYVVEFCDKQMLLCDLCGVKGVHIGCHKTAIGEITEEYVMSPGFQWFCSEECHSISSNIRDLSNRRFNLLDSTEYTYEFVRYSADSTYRPCQGIVNAAISIFHSAFGTTKYKDNTDLVELVCQGKESEDIDDDQQELDEEEEEVKPDCRGFFVLVLRKGSSILSAAAIRVQGGLFAEIPYVATKDGYRREGNCRRLMAAVESLLQDLGIKWMVMPAVDEVAEFWRSKFKFRTAAKDVYTAMEKRVLLPGGTQLLLKTVKGPPDSLPSAPSGGGGKVNVKGKKKKVRFDVEEEGEEEDASSDDEDEEKAEESEEEKVEEYKESQEEEGEGSDAETELLVNEDDDNRDINVSTSHTNNKKKPSTAPPLFPTTTTTTTITTTNTFNNDDGTNCCSNCQTIEATSWVTTDATTGTVECVLCNRYKLTHDGKARPRSVYRQTKSWKPKGWKPPSTTEKGTAGTSGPTQQASTPATTTRVPRSILKNRTTQPTSSTGAGVRGTVVVPGYGSDRVARRQRKAYKASQARQRILLLERLCERKRVQKSVVVEEARLALREDLEECAVSAGLSHTILTLGRKFEGVPTPVTLTTITGMKYLSSSDCESREAVEAVKKERDQLSQRVSQLEKELLQTENDKTTATRQLTAQQLKHTSILETLSSLQSQLQSKDAWIANTQAAVKKQQETAAKVAESVTAMQEEKQRLVAQAAAHQQLIGQAGERITALNKHLSSTQQTVVDLQGQLEEERNKVTVAAKEALAVAQRAKTALESQLAAAEAKYSVLDTQHQEVLKAIKVKEEDVLDVKRQLDTEKEEKRQLVAVVAEKDAALVKAKSVISDLLEFQQQKTAVHDATVAALRSQHTQEKKAITAELAALKSQLQQALHDNKALQENPDQQKQQKDTIAAPVNNNNNNSSLADGVVVDGDGGTTTSNSEPHVIADKKDDDDEVSPDAPVQSTPTPETNQENQKPQLEPQQDDTNADDDEEDNTVRQDRRFFSLFASKFLGGTGGNGCRNNTSSRKRKTGSQNVQGHDGSSNENSDNDEEQHQCEGEVGDNWNTNNTTTIATANEGDDDESNQNTTPLAAGDELANHQAATPGGGGSSDLIMPIISMNSARKPPPTDNQHQNHQTPPSVHLRKKVKKSTAVKSTDTVDTDENITVMDNKKKEKQQVGTLGSPAGKKGKGNTNVGIGSSSGGGRKINTSSNFLHQSGAAALGVSTRHRSGGRVTNGGVLETVVEEEGDADKKAQKNNSKGGKIKTAKQPPPPLSERRFTRNRKQQVNDATTSDDKKDRDVEKALATAIAVAEALGGGNDSD